MTSENKVLVRRTFECDAETLFRWLTTPELIVQWFGPEDFNVGEVKNDLREGGFYSIELEKKDVMAFTVTGRYLEIRPPFFLKFSYDYIGLERPSSTVSFSLTEIGSEQTDLQMVQQFEVQTPDFATRTKAWEFMMTRLESLI